MDIYDSVNRKPFEQCLPCFALERSPARFEPHASLRLEAAVTTATGVREQFICAACGKRMVRFLACQTNPAPSDVWRYERTVVNTVLASGDTSDTRTGEPNLEPDPEMDAADECAPAPEMSSDNSFAFTTSHY